jgi:magnesium transporter
MLSVEKQKISNPPEDSSSIKYILRKVISKERVDNDITFEIQDLKRAILRVRRSVFPLKEVISRFQNMENELIKPRTINYINDLHDHIIQVS